MKYRKLNLSELEGLRDDFVQFLSSNSITADDWVRIKKEDKDAAEKLIEVFSDIVWTKVLTKIKFVKLVTRTVLRVMHFGEETAELIQLKIEKDDFNFANPELTEQLAQGNLDLASYDPEMITGSKTYSNSREIEVFLALEQGGQPAEEVFWLALKSMLPKEESKS
ncbi:MAG: DUF6495 family protein [Flavobacteriales bacterium]|nr:DUF6495 family protein [Flavobacteriales bacterium]